jgi:hypothetical protein
MLKCTVASPASSQYTTSIPAGIHPCSPFKCRPNAAAGTLRLVPSCTCPRNQSTTLLSAADRQQLR